MRCEKYSHLFEPITIHDMTVKNRLVMPPMGTNFANPDHSVSEKYKDYFEARAKGGVGAIVMEYTCVDKSGLSAPFQMGIYSDDQIQGLSEVAEIAHRYGVKAGVQIQHGGIQAAYAEGGAMGPTAMNGAREMTKDDIQHVVQAFGTAAVRVKKAGMDFVEIHGASGYLINEFMSPFYNKRSDEYGKDLDGYLRFPMEVLQCVRKAVGPDFPVTFRGVGEEHLEGGCPLEERIEMLRRLAEAGADAIHVAGGTVDNMPYVIAPESVEPGYNVKAAFELKKVVKVPVIVVGRLHDPAYAENVIASGQADMVALGRALIVDPDYPNKIASGRENEIRPCIFCLQHCLDIPAHCTQNPDFGFEGVHFYSEAKKARKVLVVGSGPAGLEAAATAARRGHIVTLYEREDHLGGETYTATLPPYKKALQGVINYRVSQLKRYGAEVRLNSEVNLDVVENEMPEALILATGATPVVPHIEGVHQENIRIARDVLLQRTKTGRKVAVIGGGSVGVETAEFLLNQGKDVTVIEMMDTFSKDMAAIPRMKLMDRLSGRAAMYAGTKVMRFRGSDIDIEKDGKAETLHGFDTIVLAIGYRSYDPLSEEVQEKLPNVEVHLIGDAAPRGRTIWNAVKEGNLVGRLV